MYGSNLNKTHLDKYIKYKYLTNGSLHNYKLVFNHFFLYANIEKNNGSIVNGIIIETNDDILNKLKYKEFGYNLIDVNINTENNIIKCKAYKSNFNFFNIGILPYYKKLIREGYEEHNIEHITMNEINYETIKAIINLSGGIFGIYLIIKKFYIIGISLLIVDISMFIDQIFNNTRIFNYYSIKYPRIFFIIFKIIPTFFFAPYLMFNSSKLLKIISTVFFIVDIITLIKYYISM